MTFAALCAEVYTIPRKGIATDVATKFKNPAEKKAVAVDPGIKTSNLKRLRRIEGQVRGLEKMVEEDRYCPDIMMQLSAVHEALRIVGRELMRNHLTHCATEAIVHGSPDRAKTTYDELLNLIYKHAR